MLDLSQRVLTTLRECLVQSAEAVNGMPANAVVVDVIAHKFAFDPARLEASREKIAEFCRELPPQFIGDGLPFQSMCLGRDGHQWGEHRDCEHLLALALATGQASFLPAERSRWAQLPGGVPYVVFTTGQH